MTLTLAAPLPLLLLFIFKHKREGVLIIINGRPLVEKFLGPLYYYYYQWQHMPYLLGEGIDYVMV